MDNDREQDRYSKIIEYLNQDDCYWLNNDKWSTKNSPIQDIEKVKKTKYIKFYLFDVNIIVKNELKFYISQILKNKKMTVRSFFYDRQFAIKYLIKYINEYHPNLESLKDVNIKEDDWKNFLVKNGFELNSNNEIKNTKYRKTYHTIPNFIKEFYNETKEMDRNIWYARNIEGVVVSETAIKHGEGVLNFTTIPIFYLPIIKSYMKIMVNAKAWLFCYESLKCLKRFFSYFYDLGCGDGFIKNLTRKDLETYFEATRLKYTKPYANRFVVQLRHFLTYLKGEELDLAPILDVSELIFLEDSI